MDFRMMLTLIKLHAQLRAPMKEKKKANYEKLVTKLWSDNASHNAGSANASMRNSGKQSFMERYVRASTFLKALLEKEGRELSPAIVRK